MKSYSNKIFGKTSNSENQNQTNSNSDTEQIIKQLNARCVKYNEAANAFENKWLAVQNVVESRYGKDTEYAQNFSRYGQYLKNLVVSVFETYTNDIMYAVKDGASVEDVSNNLKSLKHDNLTDMNDVMQKFQNAYEKFIKQAPFKQSDTDFKSLIENMSEIYKWMGKVYRQLDAGFVN